MIFVVIFIYFVFHAISKGTILLQARQPHLFFHFLENHLGNDATVNNSVLHRDGRDCVLTAKIIR